jgi:hypothetical protein
MFSFSTAGRRPYPGFGDQFLCGNRSSIFDEGGPWRWRGWIVGLERQPGEGRNKSGVAVAAVAAGGPLGGDRVGGQGDGRVGEGCGVGAGVAA